MYIYIYGTVLREFCSEDEEKSLGLFCPKHNIDFVFVVEELFDVFFQTLPISCNECIVLKCTKETICIFIDYLGLLQNLFPLIVFIIIIILHHLLFFGESDNILEGCSTKYF